MNAPTFRLSIATDHRNGGQPLYAEITAQFETPQDAADFVATLPKVMGLKATTLSLYENGTHTNLGYVQGHATLQANGTNGGKNETGIKRLNRWVKDLNVAYWDRWSNSYATLDEALAAIA